MTPKTAFFDDVLCTCFIDELTKHLLMLFDVINVNEVNKNNAKISPFSGPCQRPQKEPILGHFWRGQKQAILGPFLRVPKMSILSRF